jgi:hypothetical protein
MTVAQTHNKHSDHGSDRCYDQNLDPSETGF